MLMWPAFKSSSLPIGIDLGRTGARLVQLETDGAIVRVKASHLVDFGPELDLEAGMTPRPSDVAETLRSAFDAGGFTGRRVAVCVPRELVTIKTLRLPTMPVEDLLAAAETEFRQANGLSREGWVIQPIPGAEVRQGGEVRHELTAFAVRTGDIDLLTEQWHDAGFEPVVLDVEPCALYRTIARFVRRRDDQNEVNVLVDISSRRTQVIIGRGTEMCFTKQIDVGETELSEAVARKLSVTPDEARVLRDRQSRTSDPASSGGSDGVRHAVQDAMRPLAEQIGREVSACLRYFSVNFRGTRPTRVRVSGGGALDAQFMSQLSGSLLVPAEPARIWDGLVAGERHDDAPRWTTALGLALHGTRGPFADQSGTPRRAQADVVIDSAVEAVHTNPEPVHA
jgi:type IV pilus assembly protein PilM